jgi:anti-sigma-K factor RskA
MSGSSFRESEIDAVQSCLADRALWGRDLSSADEGEAASMRIVDHLDESFDYAAAAIDVAIFPPTEEAPASLRAAVHERLTRLAQAAEPTPMPSLVNEPRRDAPPPAPSPRWGWYAAAVAIVIAAVAWWPEFGRTPATPPASPDFLVTRLLEEPTTTQVQCSCTEDPLCRGEKSCGDVVWNPERGEGYLRLVGIEPNDPREFQYQLWIVDATRDERYPVDGGVFDVPSDCAEVIVPIRAALPVGSAALFAVSVEKPGGVVVSDRRFVAVAPVG